ncbi:MAG: glucosaminidase domain-containing protein [Saprospiraceae bacterium]|nr:glucosaminidase domain-containing protein [Saprospiraceae bacterium]MDZ4702630.1 glucosaminidase domain-containing protein [Saprospiraceae bacterium]
MSKMNKSIVRIQHAAQRKMQSLQLQAEVYVRRYWFRVFLLGLAIFLLESKDVSINLNLNSAQASLFDAVPKETYLEAEAEATNVPRALNTSLLESAPAPEQKEKTPDSKPDHNLANTFSNLSFSDSKASSKDQGTKRQKQFAYVKRFAAVAQTEMKKFGIPASVTLAQGLLESNVGESSLATRNNNHFGIKCFSRNCRRGHCSNYTDDSHKDFFRTYKSPWESYRAHSLMLYHNKRYKHLFDLKNHDYKGWSYGLKKAGYATDPNYGEKIAGMIEDLDLHQYDN